MSTITLLALVYWAFVAGLTVWWHIQNWPTIAMSTKATKESYVTLSGAHMMSLTGLLGVACGHLSTHPFIPYTISIVLMASGALTKLRSKHQFSHPTWHLPGPIGTYNRFLIGRGWIKTCHLANDLLALLPLVMLVALHYF